MRKKHVVIKQEPAIKIISQKLKDMAIWKDLFISNIFQLLAIWVMLLLQFVSEHKFSIDDYIGNLLVFDIVACATNLSDKFGEDNSKIKEMPTFFTIGILILIICFASILYCLSLICDWDNGLQINKNSIMLLSIIFTLIVILINMWQAVRR